MPARFPRTHPYSVRREAPAARRRRRPAAASNAAAPPGVLPGQAEVRDAEVAVARHEEVPRLEVSVDDPVVVEVSWYMKYRVCASVWGWGD